MDDIINIIEDFLVILDSEGNIIHANKVVTKKLGYSFSELQNKSALLLHPSERREEAGLILKKMLNGTENVCRVPLQTKSGELIPVETKVAWGQWQDRKAIIGISRDVTETDLIYRLLVESIPDLFFVLNKEGLFLDFIGDPKDLYLEPAHFIGKHYHEILPADISRKLDAAISKTLNTNLPEEFEYSFEFNNCLRHFNARVLPIIVDKQWVIAREVSEQVESRELLILNNKLQSILTKIASDYINMPLSNIEIAINESLEEMGKSVGADRSYIFEYDWAKMVCNNTFEWCEDGISQQIDELQNVPLDIIPYWVEAHRKGETMYIPDVFALSENDAVRKILEPQEVKSLITLPMMDGEYCTGFIGFDSVKKHHLYTKNEEALLMVFSEMLVNVRRRQSLENNLITEKRRAEAANYAKSEFLANMSHEIRTPLNAVLGFSEALYHKLEVPEERKMINTVIRSGNLLLSLLNDILDLSKIEAEKIEMTYRPVDIIHIIDEISTLYSEKVHKMGVALSVNISESVPDCLILEELRIKQIIFNLVGNAVKFTHKGYIIIQVGFIRDDIRKGTLFLEVTDTGIGIPEDQQELIFESFRQQSGQSNTRYEGMGLGLAISRRLARKMGGEISVESKVNEGSAFRMTMPDVQLCQEEPVKKDLFHNKFEVTFNDSTLMIVDDVASNILTVQALLEEKGIKIISAENGQMALELLNHTMPDIILLDISMPGMDGYEVAQRLRQEPALKSIPVVAYSTPTRYDADSPLAGNFSGVLFKPVGRSELFDELMKHLNYKKSERKINIAPIISLSDEVVSDEIREKLPEIIEILQTHYVEELEKISSHLILFKIESFAKELKKTANYYKFDYLHNYADQLVKYIQMIDLDMISAQLDKFPMLIEELRNLKTNKN